MEGISHTLKCEPAVLVVWVWCSQTSRANHFPLLFFTPPPPFRYFLTPLVIPWGTSGRITADSNSINCIYTLNGCTKKKFALSDTERVPVTDYTRIKAASFSCEYSCCSFFFAFTKCLQAFNLILPSRVRYKKRMQLAVGSISHLSIERFIWELFLSCHKLLAYFTSFWLMEWAFLP